MTTMWLPALRSAVMPYPAMTLVISNASRHSLSTSSSALVAKWRTQRLSISRHSSRLIPPVLLQSDLGGNWASGRNPLTRPRVRYRKPVLAQSSSIISESKLHSCPTFLGVQETPEALIWRQGASTTASVTQAEATSCLVHQLSMMPKALGMLSP